MGTILKYLDNGEWKPFLGDVPAPSNSIVSNNTPTGDIDGTNTVFTTGQPYIPGSLEVYVNGLLQVSGIHYTETNPATGEFTFDEPPLTGDNIVCNYMVANTATGNADTLDGYHLSGILEAIYPVGSIYIGSTDGTMPALIASIGTWVRVEGRVIVGVDDGDSDFDYNDTGGAKTHTLTVAEIPSHTHGVIGSNSATPGFAAAARRANDSSGNIAAGATATGGGGAHNNLQPYKAKYMWERVA